MIKNLANFQKKIGINFHNQKLLTKCFTHKSYNPVENNEKLEFLGDRVLGLVISQNLLKFFPNDKEGDLDKKLASLVNKKQCAVIAKDINLQEYILIKNSNNKTNIENKVLSDCLESVIGCIYLDQGLEVAEKFIIKNWKKYLNKSLITERDSKTKLQEYSLKNYKSLPVYKLLENKGPRHKPLIKVSVNIKNSKNITATGNSKKEAEQKAAKKLLTSLKLS
ncbi:ribonuclease III [Candidatus Pelagibacter sp.]|nr:ribonuclease III [Candidatus Pelagibacter sp.]